MQELQKIVESQIENINNNFPSIYSKTDVLAILNNIIRKQNEIEISTNSISEDTIESILLDFNDSIREADLCDYESAVFEIGYRNTIELSDINVNREDIVTILREILCNFIAK